MTDPDPTRPRADVKEVLEDLENRRSTYEEFCREMVAHIEKCLQDDQILIQSVQWRVKKREKVHSKYSDPAKADKYTNLDDLTDIAGLRVITYYEDDVDVVQGIIEREFSIDRDNCEDRRVPKDPESFTYHALHLVVSLTSATLGNRTHRHFAGMRAEIQITSILRHAWAEIEHKWYDLKDSFPPKAKRRFARLSALIEMADLEFVSLRNEFEQSKESTGKMLQGGVPDVPIDAQSLRAFIEQDRLVHEIDQEIASAARGKMPFEQALSDETASLSEKILRGAGLATVSNLRKMLQDRRAEIIKLALQVPHVEPRYGLCITLLVVLLINRNLSEEG